MPREPSSHLVVLGSTEWTLWRWVLLRGAGFAARRVLALGSDELASQLDAEERAGSQLRHARSAVIDHCVKASTTENPAVKKASRRVEKNKDVEDTGVAEVDALLATYRAARQALASSQAETVAVVARERARTAGAIQDIGRDALFREALTWQNRAAIHEGVDGMLEDTQDNSKARQRQRLVAKYWQRYTVKNDSIGFFGPIAWAELAPAPRGLAVTPASVLVDRRIFRFEDWAVHTLASVLSQMPETQSIFVPRRRPLSWLEGDRFMLPPPTPPRQLSRADAFLIDAVDGARTALQIAERAAADPAASELNTIDEAFTALARLGSHGLISYEIEVPADLDDSAQWLHDTVEAIADPASRQKALEPLRVLEAAREDVIRAAGNAEALDRAIDALEQRFQEITNRTSKRDHGKTYAGRQIFYEDCSRAVDLELGPRVLDEISSALSIVLLSARWYTFQVGTKFQVEIQAAFRELCQDQQSSRIPLGSFMQRVVKLLPGDQYVAPPFMVDVKTELHRRWKLLLGAAANDTARREIVIASNEIRAQAEELFAAPGPGWPRARYHSPDLLIAARNAEDVERGAYRAILGEVHCGTNTLFLKLAYRFHPDPEAIKAAWDCDMQTPCIAPVRALAGRASHQPVSDRDIHIEIGRARSWRPPDHVVSGGDLVVESDAERLVVRNRQGTFECDIMRYMDDFLSNGASTHFSLWGSEPHLPRVVIDNLVIGRERWSYKRADFEELTAGGDDVVQRVGRWRARRGLPRHVFGKVPNEPKPFFMDFASPVLIEIFVRYLQEAQTLSFTEMTPDFSELWLPDASDARYTSELRVVAVDPIAWSPDLR